MRSVILDFETRCDIDLKKAGVERYVQSEFFEAACLAWTFDNGDGADQPVHGWDILQDGMDTTCCPELFDHIEKGGHVVAHNARFEITCWNELHRRAPDLWPRLRTEQVTDTMALARAVSMPAGLGDLAPALRLPFAKDKEGHALMLRLCKPRKPRKGEVFNSPQFHGTPAELARQLEYCKQDVVVERAVWRALPKLSADEIEMWNLDQEINDTGVYVDVAAAAACADLVAIEKERLDRELFLLTGGYVKTANSAKALRNWLAAWDCYLPDLKKGTVDEALNGEGVPVLADNVRRALAVRQEAARSSTGKLAAVLRGVCADGRMRGLMGYHGASTGRWVGSRFNPLNLPRTPENFTDRDSQEVFEWLNFNSNGDLVSRIFGPSIEPVGLDR